MESECGIREHGPSDLFSGSCDEPVKHFQPRVFATFVGTKVDKKTLALSFERDHLTQFKYPLLQYSQPVVVKKPVV
jgi:hypothetical protein